MKNMGHLFSEINALSLKMKASLIEYICSKLEEEGIPNTCPKCRKTARITKAGRTRKDGKQLYLCHSCGKRFVLQHDNQLLFFSHANLETKKSFVVLAISGNSLDELSAKLGIARSTAHKWKKKLFAFIEQNQELFSKLSN